jgi:hypothetical protein
MKAQQRGGSQNDRGTNQPVGAYEEPTDAGNQAIREAKVG